MVVMIPFAFLKVYDAIWPLKTMPGAVDATNASDGVVSRIPRMRLAYCVEVGSTRADLFPIIRSPVGTREIVDPPLPRVLLPSNLGGAAAVVRSAP